jgi:hypothetical protein
MRDKVILTLALSFVALVAACVSNTRDYSVCNDYAVSNCPDSNVNVVVSND